ncbi:DUF58 domain-containing protein [Pseudomonas sp. NCCP-436]|uniref:DUF58 domain-containing protein n=1 Tax=Pseudomonas sp. NCCP-436 TaxID=2842481 RepID=UPI001C823AB3|nr:DUF58 domain-containing protein [Pseudomonas sp. NCCP-436]GIZ11910.1 hypothetical protein NCCP436_13260 [Pseudomonas sp. NCCP-436]
MQAALKPLWRRWLARRIPPATSVQLNQRRIFILPSRIGVAFAGVLLLMLLVGINYQNSLAYALTFLLLSVFVVTILHTYRNLSGLVLKAGGASAVFAGEQACLRVRLEGGERGHCAVALGWPTVGLQLCDVSAGGQAEVELGVLASRRGWMRPERLRVESRFPLGLLVAWSWVDLDQVVLVYPQPLPGDLPLSAGEADEQEEGMRLRNVGADDFLGLRDYQPGDSRRRLDWKAYSRGQGLLVKDFASLGGRDLWLDFDTFDGDCELRLSCLCHWVLVLSERRQSFGLRLPGQAPLAPDTGSDHREACLRALALFGEPV